MNIILLQLVLISSYLVTKIDTQSIVCGGTYRGNQYTITSPNYPNDYPNSQDCVYNLQADDYDDDCANGTKFRLKFQDFVLRASNDCRDDYLLIGDRHVFCGTVTGSRTFAGNDNNNNNNNNNNKNNNNSLTLRFRTNDEGTAKGFKILITVSSCSSKRTDNRPSNHANEIIDPTANAKKTNSADQYNHRRVTSYFFLPPADRASSAAISNSNDKNETTIVDGYQLPPSLRPALDFNKPNDKQNQLLSASTALDKSSIYLPAYKNPSSSFNDPAIADCDDDRRESSENDASRQQSSLSSVNSDFIYIPHRGLVNTGYQQQQGAYYPPGYNYYNNYNGYQVAGNYYRPNQQTASNFFPNPYPYNALPGTLNQGECCRLPRVSSNVKRFLIASPGFPSTNHGNYACRYTITKSTPDVCRLRLNLRFFNYGRATDVNSLNCNYGYLELDGRRYCGCRTGQTILAPFGDYYAKPIDVVSYAGYPGTKFVGFLVDVIQESCGIASYSYRPNVHPPIVDQNYNTLYPSLPYANQRPCSLNYRYTSSYPCNNAQQTYQTSNNDDTIYSPYYQRRDDQAATTNSSSSLAINARNKRELGYVYARPGIPYDNSGAYYNYDRARERTFVGSCADRLFLDWILASKEALLRGARCDQQSYNRIQRRTIARVDDKCDNIDDPRGVLRSYAAVDGEKRVEKCWRFTRRKDNCKLALHFVKFRLETSKDCVKGYLSFNDDDERYCGASLNDRKSIFDLSQTNSVEIRFVSESQINGNGFDIVFSQQPCEVSTSS